LPAYWSPTLRVFPQEGQGNLAMVGPRKRLRIVEPAPAETPR
jgi:hypothetical protein